MSKRLITKKRYSYEKWLEQVQQIYFDQTGASLNFKDEFPFAHEYHAGESAHVIARQQIAMTERMMPHGYTK